MEVCGHLHLWLLYFWEGILDYLLNRGREREREIRKLAIYVIRANPSRDRFSLLLVVYHHHQKKKKKKKNNNNNNNNPPPSLPLEELLTCVQSLCKITS
jgi:hypothetical protein